ncbi:MAG: hypothetical protein JNM33_07470 [Rubrivivax sp.]|nr:hypothetical protein [Rubrivivax sp.]
MNTLLHVFLAARRLWAARARLVWLGLLAVLAGCGPGLGGTGTGADDVDGVPGATLAPLALCNSDLGPLLGCTAAAGAAGSTLSWWADGTTARDALLRVEGNGAELDAACSGWLFSGVWAAQGAQSPRFHGTARTTAGGPLQAATLTAQRVDSTLVVQLLDAAGRPLAGPFTLRATPTALPAGTCH